MNPSTKPQKVNCYHRVIVKDAWNPQTIGVSHLKPAPGPAPEHLSPPSADLQGWCRGQARLRGCPQRGCGGGDAAAAACWEAQGSGGLLGLGPLRGGACSALEESAAFTASLPHHSPPSLLHFYFFFPPFPACFSQLLPWGPSLGEGSCLCRMERASG